MKRIEKLKAQHKEILQNAEEISSLLEAMRLKKAHDVALNLLSTLAIKLYMHSAKENEVIYTELIDHENADIRSAAKRFISDMCEINDAFSGYIKKWSAEVSIQNNPSEFIGESKDLINTISRRLTREEEELFPLIENN